MDYEFKTTFWMDFNIAENYGIDAVKETFNRVFREWKTNYTFLYELTIVMNLKCWDHYEKNNIEISKLYAKYYHQLRDYGLNNLKGKELEYFVNNLYDYLKKMGYIHN